MKRNKTMLVALAAAAGGTLLLRDNIATANVGPKQNPVGNEQASAFEVVKQTSSDQMRVATPNRKKRRDWANR